MSNDHKIIGYTKLSNDNKIIGYTKINKESYDFTWVISDYLLVLEVEEGKIESPIFDIGNDHQAQFQFKLKKCKDATTDKIHLYLLCVKTNAKMKSSYKISVMRGDVIVHRAMDGHTFHGLGLKKIFDVDTCAMNEFCSSTGTVTIHCQLTIATESTQNSLMNNETVEANEVPKPKSFDDEICDALRGTVVLLTASEKKLAAPRSILAKSSAVFKEMMDHGKSHYIYIDMKNVSYKAAMEMLRYMSTGRIESREFSLMDKILAADSKYQIKGLKQKCEDILISDLCPKNRLDNIVLADKYDLPRLRERALLMLATSR